MAGNSNSGRKPQLSEMTLDEILHVSSTILLRWLSNPEVPDSVKIPVVSQLISKRIPTKTILEGDNLGQRNITNVIYPEGWRPKEERIVGSETQSISG